MARSRGAVRRWGIRALQLVLTVAVTGFILDRVGITAADVSGLEDRWLRPDPGLLAVASVVFLAALFLSAAFWGRMVKELGGPRLSFSRSATVYFASNLGRYIPGKIWQLAGLAYLAKKEGVSSATATAAAVLVQAVSLAGATVVGAWALAVTPGVAGGWGVWGAAGILLAVAVSTVPPVFDRLLAVWFRLVRRARPSSWADAGEPSGPTGDVADPARMSVDEREPGPAGGAGGDRGAARGRGAAFGPRWVLLFAANWLVYSASFWLMARSFSVDAPFLALAPAFAAAYVLGYLMVFAPAGIGVREGFLVAFLQPSVGGAAATALALLARFWMTVLELVPAVAFGSVHLVGKGGVEEA